MRMIFLIIPVVLTTFACKTTDAGEDRPDIPGKIVFSARSGDDDGNIYVMNADGSNLKQLTFFEGGEFATQPAWSPDGTKIAYAAFTEETPVGSTGLYVMEADGSDQRPLVFHPQTGRPMFGSHPAWSPDGTRVAFDYCVNCELFGKNREIFVADLETGAIDTLVQHPAGDTHPTWSPDGQRIAFASDRDYFDADSMRWREDLYVIDVDGNNLTRLTETGNATRPVWSPDGNFIIYEWGRGGNNVYLYGVSSRQITLIDSGLQFSGNPMWNKNDTQLLVSGRQSEGASPEMRLLDIEAKPPEVLQSLILNKNAIGRDYDWYNDQ